MSGSRDIWDAIFGRSGDDDAEPAELDPELESAIEVRDGVHYLRHPACCEEYDKHSHQRYNARLAEWKSKREQARKQGNWRAYVDCYEKRFWVDALMETKNQGPALEWAQLVRDTWILSDELWDAWPKWREVFSNRAELPGFMTAAETDYLALQSDPIEVYRGCHEASIDGLSWTMDWKTAQYSASQIKPRSAARIIQGRVNRADVFAFVDKKEESEIIVFPELVSERKVLMKSGGWLDG